MARRIQQQQISESDIIQSEVAGRNYPVDVLKDLFVKSGMTPKRISQKFFISLPKLMEYAETFEWFRLKKEHDRLRLFTALNIRADSFLDHMTADQREQSLKMDQRNQELEEVEKHYAQHHHLFCVDEYGNVLRNKITGLPIKMEFGSSKEELQERRELQASVELNVKLLSEAIKRLPIDISDEIINIDSNSSIKKVKSLEQAADAIFEDAEKK